ncbi:MAG: helix-turn-helix transcriptional regulator [Nitrospina sp.]|nr:helix-turn-helix transcriptional regulator [Nitrospina sp.]
MRIRMWRKDRGLRANELARKLKISGGSLSEIENGKSFPSAPTLASMHLNTDLNVGYVLTGQAAKNLKKTPRTLLVEIDANIDHVVLKNRKNA